MSNKNVAVTLQQQADYRFAICFDEAMPILVGDEPAPLRKGLGPSPVQLPCPAVGNCLGDSLFFAFRKFKQRPDPIHCTVSAVVGSNAHGRMRILHIDARLQLGTHASDIEHAERVLAKFEEFCTVTQSVGKASPSIPG